MKKNLSPELIQRDYDSGMSYRQLQKKYGMSSRTLTLMHRQGFLKTRNKSDAAKLEHKQNPHKHTEAFKESQRSRINSRYENGWLPKAGRCKKIKYTSAVAGEISVDGTWELAVAKYFDEQCLVWSRNTKRFPYTDMNGKLRHYTPDFWVENWNTYIEVKGYETELDRCKWASFPHKLQVWKRDRILSLLKTNKIQSLTQTPE